MSPDYLSYEVSKAAYKLVKAVMLVEPGEKCGSNKEILPRTRGSVRIRS